MSSSSSFGWLASNASCDGVRLSTSTVSSRRRSKYRAFSRRTIVNNQCFAAASSRNESSDFQARSRDSCTTSSAIVLSRQSQAA
jgi:hypothetical protein